MFQAQPLYFQEIFLWLLFAHYLFDFSLQTSFMSEWKQKSHYVMFVHVIIWTGGICLAMKLLHLNISIYVLLMLFGVHYMTDWGKCYLLNRVELFKTPKRMKELFMMDQMVHIIQLLIVVESLKP